MSISVINLEGKHTFYLILSNPKHNGGDNQPQDYKHADWVKGEGTGIPNKSWSYMASLYKQLLYGIQVSEQDYLDLGNRNCATKKIEKKC